MIPIMIPIMMDLEGTLRPELNWNERVEAEDPEYYGIKPNLGASGSCDYDVEREESGDFASKQVTS